MLLRTSQQESQWRSGSASVSNAKGLGFFVVVVLLFFCLFVVVLVFVTFFNKSFTPADTGESVVGYGAKLG
jgi:hypothetical protein